MFYSRSEQNTFCPARHGLPRRARGRAPAWRDKPSRHPVPRHAGADSNRPLRCLVPPCDRHVSSPRLPRRASMTLIRGLTGRPMNRPPQHSATTTADGTPTSRPRRHQRRRTRAPLPTQAPVTRKFSLFPFLLPHTTEFHSTQHTIAIGMVSLRLVERRALPCAGRGAREVVLRRPTRAPPPRPVAHRHECGRRLALPGRTMRAFTSRGESRECRCAPPAGGGVSSPLREARAPVGALCIQGLSLRAAKQRHAATSPHTNVHTSHHQQHNGSPATTPDACVPVAQPRACKAEWEAEREGQSPRQ